MSSVSAIILFITQVHVNGLSANFSSDRQGFVDKFAQSFVNQLLDRALQASLTHSTGLHHTTLGKPGHLVSSPRMCLSSFPVHATHNSFPHPHRTSGVSASPLASYQLQFPCKVTRAQRTQVHKAATSDTIAPPVESEEISSTGAKIPEKFDSQFLQTMLDRGFIHQCTDFKELDKKFKEETVVAYLGFDATASSLHVGSLLQIMILRTLQKFGHKPIILLGGGTTKVGDPSGKDESRQLLTEETIQSNADNIAQVFKKFIKFGDGPSDAIMVNNAEWLDGINYLEFLRDYGTQFTINRMLSFESVKQRLAREQPLTFLEFNYMLLQAYDFVELKRRHGATLQLGGSDQWGNIISGIELGRKVDGVELFGLTAPLVTTSDGKKMGKTAAGAVWLNKDLLSEFDYWQFWRNTADADVIRFMKLFTDLPMEKIDEMAKWEGAELNAAKKILADEATSLLHGSDGLETIHATAKSLFEGGGAGKDLDSLPQVALTSEGMTIVDALTLSNLAKSKSDARRKIAANAVSVNNEKIKDENAVLEPSAYDDQGRIKLSFGKKTHVVLNRPT